MKWAANRTLCVVWFDLILYIFACHRHIPQIPKFFFLTTNHNHLILQRTSVRRALLIWINKHNSQNTFPLLFLLHFDNIDQHHASLSCSWFRHACQRGAPQPHPLPHVIIHYFIWHKFWKYATRSGDDVLYSICFETIWIQFVLLKMTSNNLTPKSYPKTKPT